MIPESGAAEATEDRKRVLRGDLPDELAARLDLTLDPLRELAGFLLRAGAHDQEAPAAHDVVALALELVRQLARLGMRLALDANLPRGVAALELLFLPRLLRRLARPALLVVEPALDGRGARLDAFFRELGFDDPARPFGLGRGRGVDEELVAVAGDGKPSARELLRETLRLVCAKVEPEAAEQAFCLGFFGQLDPDAPVVSHVVGAASPISASGRPNIL